MLTRKPNIDPMELLNYYMFAKPIPIPTNPQEEATQQIMQMLSQANSDISTYINFYEYYHDQNLPDDLAVIIENHLDNHTLKISAEFSKYVQEFGKEELAVEIRTGIADLSFGMSRLTLAFEEDPQDVDCVEPGLGDLQNQMAEIDQNTDILPPGPNERALLEQIHEVKTEIIAFSRLYQTSENMPDPVHILIDNYFLAKINSIESELEMMRGEYGSLSDEIHLAMDSLINPIIELLNGIETDPTDPEDGLKDCGPEIEGFSQTETEIEIDYLIGNVDDIVVTDAIVTDAIVA